MILVSKVRNLHNIMTLLFLIFYLFNFDFVLIHRFLYLFLFCFIFGFSILFFLFRFDFDFFFWLSLVEMLPMPNPFVPEEHEPWCPYSLIQLNCMIAMSLHIFEPFFSMHVVFFIFAFCCFVFLDGTLRRVPYAFFNYQKGILLHGRCQFYIILKTYSSTRVAHLEIIIRLQV